MELDERDAIREYEEAKEYLPLVETVGGLAPADFDHSAYPQFANDKLAALEDYLKQLDPYYNRLKHAADLRQKHYRYFIKAIGRVEERGHRAWRKEMNKLVADCEAMLEHWKKQKELAFDKAIAINDRILSKRQNKIEVDFSVKNIEYNPKEKQNAKAVMRPSLSETEKIRRKKQLKKLREHKREGEIMFKQSLKEFKPDYKKIEDFHNIEVKDITLKEAIVFCQEIRSQIFGMEENKLYTRKFINFHIKESVENRTILFLHFVDMFHELYLLKKADPNYKVEHKLNCLLDEFNDIYLYSNCWTSDNMIAGNKMIDYLYTHPQVVQDLLDPDMVEVSEPIEKLVCSIIWPWTCKYLITVCKNMDRLDSKNPLMLSVKTILKMQYPTSFYNINTPYLDDILHQYSDPRTAAIALYKRNDKRVTPPERDYKLFKEYFGEYPKVFGTEYWNVMYKQFLALIK